MKKIIVGLLVSVGILTSAQAHAWGAQAQGILIGAAGLWTLQQLTRPNAVFNVNGNPVIINPQPVYIQQPVVVSPPVYVQQHQAQQWCESVPVVDQFGNQRTVQYCYYR